MFLPLLLAVLALPARGRTELQVPKNQGWVTDLAGLLSSDEERELETLMESYKQGSTHEIALLTIPSLEGDDLEAFTLRVGRAWGIGGKDKNNGALLLVSKGDRAVRIEVGTGLEGNLTDSISGRIIRDVILPRFKQGQFAAGLKEGVLAIHEAIGGDYGRIEARRGRGRKELTGGTIAFIVIMIVILSILKRISRGGGRHRGRGVFGPIFWGGGLGGPHIGGGGGGFGGGFSGFGGGGGFSGGGASGEVVMSLAAMVQHGAQDAWDAESHPILGYVATYGPWVLGGATLFVVLRALVRSHRYRAASVLGEDAQAAVNDAIRSAESRTLGEIVPVVLERSEDHAAARWRCALFGLLVGSTLLESFLPWSIPEQLLACQLALGALGYALARLLPDLERMFVFESHATHVTEEQAIQEFHRQGLRETKDRTGVLVLVSLFERRVVVLGDEGIHAKAGDDHWRKTRDLILSGIARGALADGIREGIRACGEVLAAHHPSPDGGANEIGDRLVVRAR